MNKFFSLLICVFLFAQLNGQTVYEDGFVIEKKDGLEDVIVHSLGKKGFMLIEIRETDDRKINEIVFKHHNTDMKLVKSQKTEISGKLDLTHFYSTDDYYSTLFSRNSGEYTLISFDALSQEMHIHSGKLPSKGTITDIIVMGDWTYLKTIDNGMLNLLV